MEQRDQKRKKKKMSVTPNSSPPSNGNDEVKDHHQNSLSSSSAQTLNNLQNPHPPPLYRECLKNHATATGGHVVDGCGEFMPAGEDSLKCAACDCHRNFHRRELPNCSAVYYGGGFHHPPVSYFSNAASTMPPPPLSLIPDRRQSMPAIPVMMAFGGGGADSATSEEDRSNSGGGDGSSGKKRFRTKFTAQQKEKMAEFAEKLGWKISKQDEGDLARFCADMGIQRQVFKVWMHNSKQALKKKNQDED